MRASLVKQAIVGLSRGTADYASGWPTDQLLPQDSQLPAEHRFLLQAGLEAVYEQAGQLPTKNNSEVPLLDTSETPQYSSPRFENLLSILLEGSHRENAPLLGEALQLLAKHQMTVSPAILPQLLELRVSELRSLAAPVLGSRGRWLANFNKRWSWAAESASPMDPQADLERVWQEGSIAERVQALQRMRGQDAELGRTWLKAALPVEKPDTRKMLVSCLAIGLSDADIELLETVASKDRSTAVQAAALELLAKLPESNLARSLAEQAKLMLLLEDERLQVNPPESLPKEWQLEGTKPGKLGEKAWRVTQVLALVPLKLWTNYFRSEPECLIGYATRGDWADPILLGWAKAARRFSEIQWTQGLLEYWLSRYREKAVDLATVAMADLQPLIGQLPPEAIKSLVQDALKSRGEVFSKLVDALNGLPEWDEELSLLLLCRLQEVVEIRARHPLVEHAMTIATNLAPSLIDEALRRIPDGEDHPTAYFIRKFHHILQMRKQLYAEFVPPQPE